MKIYTIIGGVNGVGKTSFVGILKELDPDLGAIIDIGENAALIAIQECVAQNVSFTQETTLSGYKTEATAKQVKELGYHVRMFYVGLDTLDESLTRIQNRVRRGGHDIPHDDVTRRFSGRWEAVAKVLPYCDEAEFYDNDNCFIKVAEYRNGEFRTIGAYSPNWILDLQNFLKT